LEAHVVWRTLARNTCHPQMRSPRFAITSIPSRCDTRA
jgi:hypothetical protein